RSALLSLRQWRGGAELRVDVLRNDRKQASNFFLSRLPQYYRISPATTATWVSSVSDFVLAYDWTLAASASWGEDESIYRQTLEDMTSGASTLVVLNCFCNTLRTFDVGAEVPVFSLPGGDARLAIGSGYRANEFQQVAEQGVVVLDVEGR